MRLWLIVCGIRFDHFPSFIDFLRSDRLIRLVFVSWCFSEITRRKTGVGSVCVSGVRDYRLEGRNVFVKLGLSFGGRRGIALGFSRLR